MSQIPWEKAEELMPGARGRWEGDLGDAIRRFGPEVWPSVPGPMLQSFTMNGNRTEDTGTDLNRFGQIANPIFHEIGYFQTPAGPSAGPSPARSPDARYNDYGRLGVDPKVVRMLQRPADLRPRAWMERVEDQTAIGLLNFQEEGLRIESRVPSLTPSSLSTPWSVAMSISGYVVGAGAATFQLRLLADRLAAVPEAQRLDALMRLVGSRRTRTCNDRTAAYLALRIWQRFEYGKQLARAEGLSTAWFPAIVEGPDREAIARNLVEMYESGACRTAGYTAEEAPKTYDTGEPDAYGKAAAEEPILESEILKDRGDEVYSPSEGSKVKEDESTKKGLLIGDEVVPPSNPDSIVPLVVGGSLLVCLLVLALRGRR